MPQCGDGQSLWTPLQASQKSLAGWRNPVQAVCLLKPLSSGLRQVIASGMFDGRLSGKNQSNALTPRRQVIFRDEPAQRHELRRCAMGSIIHDGVDLTQSD